MEGRVHFQKNKKIRHDLGRLGTTWPVSGFRRRQGFGGQVGFWVLVLGTYTPPAQGLEWAGMKSPEAEGRFCGGEGVIVPRYARVTKHGAERQFSPTGIGRPADSDLPRFRFFSFHPAVLPFFTYAEKLTVMFSMEAFEVEKDSVEMQAQNEVKNRRKLHRAAFAQGREDIRFF